MARPKKENLDYFPFDTDFFSDTKVKILKAKYGTDGVCIYLYILCEIYHNGYFVEYNEDFVLTVSDYFNFPETKTEQIISYLVSRSLLERILADPVTVLTARSVQRRYQAAKKLSKRNIFVDDRIWLLKKEETEPCIKVQPFDDKSKKNDSFSEKNGSKSEIYAQSKVKESKVKESKVKCGKFQIPCKNGTFTVDEDYYMGLTHTYPNMNIDESLKKFIDFMASNPEKQRYLNGIKGSIQWWLNGDEEKGRYRKNAVSNIPTADDYSEEW